MNRTIAFYGFLLGFSLIHAGCFLPYVAKQGYYQAKLLSGRQPILQVLQQDSLTPHQRQRLQLILAVKNFATNVLALSPNQNYSTINLKWRHTLYNVSASKPLLFKPYTWWFPIIGTMPYKGFFEKADAIKEKNRLLLKNLDVQIGPVAGYSSLGYFSDPVWPQMLELPLVFLVELIIHELAHATIYFKNQTDFNESFANAVGKMGTLAFLKEHFGEKSQEYQDAISIYNDQSLYNTHMWQLYQQLDNLYKSKQSPAEKQKLKKEIIFNFTLSYPEIPFLTVYFKNKNLNNINNAYLMSFRRYNSEQKSFEELLNHVDNNWPNFLKNIRSLENKRPLG